MCHKSVLDFVKENISKDEMAGKIVLEVGSKNINGSSRDVLDYVPRKYIGIDILDGKGVDRVLDAKDILDHFPENYFDLIICTETLEHVDNWKLVVTNLKKACKKGGSILMTTRSKGFPKHEYPHDYWRFELEDFKKIFSDFRIHKLESDHPPGVLLKAVKPGNFKINSLDLEVFSI